MNLLLDTHVWLWWQMMPERLEKQVRAIIEDPANTVYLSAASSWEMAIKIAAGRLELPEPVEEMVPKTLLQDDFRALPIHNQHTFELLRLPMHHRDPFDRILIAQARADGLTLVTDDEKIMAYDVSIFGRALAEK
jgi:PIN domain nuclease of toxin-antitoxin system